MSSCRQRFDKIALFQVEIKIKLFIPIPFDSALCSKDHRRWVRNFCRRRHVRDVMFVMNPRRNVQLHRNLVIVLPSSCTHALFFSFIYRLVRGFRNWRNFAGICSSPRWDGAFFSLSVRFRNFIGCSERNIK